MGRVASGVRGILISDPDEVIGFTIVTEERNEILVVTENGYGKRTKVEEYRQQKRGGKGVKTLNITEKNGQLTKLRSVIGEEDLIITTTKGMIIRLPIEQIATSKRSTQGVRLIKLNEGHKVATIAIVQKTDDEDFIEELLDENGNPIEVVIEDPGIEEITEETTE